MGPPRGDARHWQEILARGVVFCYTEAEESTNSFVAAGFGRRARRDSAKAECKEAGRRLWRGRAQPTGCVRG